VSHSAAGAADDCLSGPQRQTPQGAHWYYRIDHTTKRHCWYLADQQRTPLAQTAAAKPPLPQDTEAAMQQSVANARAELPAPRIEQPSRSGEIGPALSADAVRPEDNGNAATPGALTQRSLVASRWPDPYSSPPVVIPSPTKRDPGTGVTPASQNQPTSVLAAEQFATADVSSQTPFYSLPLQLAALTGVLALAGIIGTVMFRHSQQLQLSEIGNRRGSIWDSTDDDRIVLSHYPGANGFARGRGQAMDRSDRIAEFFAQISRRAPT
jgi:hypothetical protein